MNSKRRSNLFLITLLLVIGCGGGKKEEHTGTNNPPEIKEIIILPSNPTLGSRLILRINAYDRDGDDINFSVNWYVNDTKIGQGIEFYAEGVRKGDKIYAEVTPDDGKQKGKTRKSDVVIIGNTAPQIRSATISPDTILTSTDELTVLGDGFDPDGDSLRWMCYWTLNYTKRISDSSTTIKIKDLNLKKGDRLSAELYAIDSDTVSNPYVLQIDIVNSPPVLKEGLDSIPYKPDSIYYKVPIIDPDKDKLTFELLDAPKGVMIDKNTGVIYGNAGDVNSFEVLVRATDTDGAYLDARFTLTAP
ncbi:MAG: Ig domain-containing protein [bacterium]